MLSRLPSSFSGRFLAVAIAITFSTAIHSAPESEFQSAFVQFSQGQTGDSSAVDKSAELFGALLTTEPGNPVLMAYAGAATTMRATTTMLPWKKMGYAEDGLAMVDKALALLTPAHNAPMQRGTPGALEVRFVAANTFLAVPGFMNRGARGAKLLDEVLASPLFAQSPLEFQGAVWLRAAKQAQAEKRLEDARKYLNEVISSNAPQAHAARAQLKDLAS
jgi:hypothetical protein